MSRVLANILGAAEPAFRQQINRLEQAAGLPGADIRLMMEITNETRNKIRELGLDPHDTTGPELYRALQMRLEDDEARLRTALKIQPDASPTELLQTVASQLPKFKLGSGSFVVKQSAMRVLLKKLQPKVTMKKLGYRSMDSMLKHEPVAQLLAAASLLESHEWQQKRLEAYKKLRANDFESKPVAYFVPTAKQWPAIAAQHTETYRHNLVMVPELGSIVLLPLAQDLPGLAITTVLLTINGLNDLRSLGSYLKLQQVRPDFGKVFAEAVQHEPMTEAELAGQALPWKVVQWFYGNGHSSYHPEAFQPHVQPEDLSWHHAENSLAQLQPALEFWQGSQLLALLDGPDTVSLNLLDVALSVCNGLDYSQRLVHNMRMNLGHELLARYLHQDNLHALLLGKLDIAQETSFELA